ncbi:MAG: arginase family protein [Candidatus Eremiobacterota bacterium]
MQLDNAVGALLYWEGIPTFLGCPLATLGEEADIALVGLPWTHNPMERTQHLAPRAVRHRSKPYRRMHREFGISLADVARIRDFGDVPINSGICDNAVLEIEKFYHELDVKGTLPFTIGGDHGCTLPVLRAIAGPKSRRKSPLGMLHFDSHTDTYGDAMELHCHAGNWARIAVEEGLIDPKRTLQVGLNGPCLSTDMDAFAENAGFRMMTLAEILEIGIPATLKEIKRVLGDEPFYLSFDLDVLTLADAPAVADPEAGGLSMNETMQILLGLKGMEMVGGDIVCFVPHLDPTMITAIHINALMHHMVALMTLALDGARKTPAAAKRAHA